MASDVKQAVIDGVDSLKKMVKEAGSKPKNIKVEGLRGQLGHLYFNDKHVAQDVTDADIEFVQSHYPDAKIVEVDENGK